MPNEMLAEAIEKIDRNQEIYRICQKFSTSYASIKNQYNIFLYFLFRNYAITCV